MTQRNEPAAISRRGFLRTLGLVASAGLIQACAPAARPEQAGRAAAGEAKPAEAAKHGRAARRDHGSGCAAAAATR